MQYDPYESIRELQHWVDELALHLDCDLTVTLHSPDGNSFVTIHSKGLTEKALAAKLKQRSEDDRQLQETLPW